MLRMSGVPEDGIHVRDAANAEYEEYEDIFVEVDPSCPGESHKERHLIDAWRIEAAGVDRSIRILPGVKKMMDSIPTGRYAVATSGAKTYGMLSKLCPSFLLNFFSHQHMGV